MIAQLSPSEDPRLRASVAALYSVFADLPPRVIEGCPCCIAKRGVDRLLTTPLRQLTGQFLWSYTSGLFLTVGSARDFRYFLPRILELSVYDQGNIPDVEIVLGKLKLANWGAWPKPERDAIEAVIDAWFGAALAQDILLSEEWFGGSEAESILCGAARAGLALAPWLERLGAPEAASVRAGLAERYARPLERGSPEETGFWEDAPEGWAAFAMVIAAS